MTDFGGEGELSLSHFSGRSGRMGAWKHDSELLLSFWHRRLPTQGLRAPANIQLN